MVTLGLGLWLLFGLGVDTFDQASLDPSSTGCRTLQTHNHFRVFGRSAVIMLEPQIVATCHHIIPIQRLSVRVFYFSLRHMF